MKYYVFLSISFLIGCVSIYLKYYAEPPKIDPNFKIPKYWGQTKLKESDRLHVDSTKVEKFTINVENFILDDLKARLNKTRFSDSIVSDFEYGMNSQALKLIVGHWLNKYNWRQHEKILNQFSHYKTEIEGIKIHFIHEKPKTKAAKVYPILISHGWPSSVWEFYKLIPLLTNTKDDQIAFEVIAPSLPGFGFSEVSHKPGLNSIETARMYVTLMKRLGHDKFFFHGNDWGSLVGKYIATIFPETLLGLHSTMFISPLSFKTALKLFIGYHFPSLIFGRSSKDLQFADEFYKALFSIGNEAGYFHIQSTKPDTVGYGLNDSPAGLAAYILEKYYTWSTPLSKKAGNRVFESFTLDEALTQVMIYWVTDTITSSVRYYKENVGALLQSDITGLRMHKISKQVPVGISIPPFDVLRVTKFLVQDQIENLIHFEHLPRGGHFPSFEEPELIADRLRNFVSMAIASSNAS